MSKDPQSDPFLLLDTTPQNIPATRRTTLDNLARKILDQHQPINLLFVCTHNSRRSQMAQAWAAWAEQQYHTPVISTHSAGTESTALHPHAAQALCGFGFDLEKVINNDNPLYHLYLPDIPEPTSLWSKTWQHPSIPRTNLVAIMVCSEAESDCPFIPGAVIRFPMPYDDPKYADNTPECESVYQDSCRQIGREINYLFTQITID